MLRWWGMVGALVLSACSGTETEQPDDGLAVAGTRVFFDPDAVIDEPEFFYDFPYPSDLRLTEDGRPNVEGYPVPLGNLVVENVKAIAGDRPGWSTMSVAYFRFDGPLAPQSRHDALPADLDQAILLVDIDERSPERGALYPLVAGTLPQDPYVPDHLLAVAPLPGVVLPAQRTFAVVVKRALEDARGQPLGVPAGLAELAAGRPQRVRALETSYAPLWDTLDTLGIDRAEVAAATVFTTGDVVEDTFAISEGLLQRYDLAIENLAIDPDDGATHGRFCELVGSVGMPQHQRGTPPFDTEGLFEMGAGGLPVEQRSETMPLVITLPKQPMPAGGYPLVIYMHGSGGLSSQVVDRGPILVEGGEETPGEGPSHVLAAHGFATLGSAHPVNPERLPGADSRAYLNFDNLAAYRDTFRQGVLEQRLLIEALRDLRIDPAVLGTCTGPSLPAGESAYRLSVGELYLMGQSMGGQYATMVGAVEPNVVALAPTGSGGDWSLLSEVGTATGLSPALVGIVLGTREELTILHPGLALLGQAWEPAEPMVYMPRLAQRPLPGHPARSIYTPVGKGDSYFPEPTFDASAIAYGVEQAGAEVWPEMQEALTLVGRGGLLSYPVKHNMVSVDGDPYTGVVVQYLGDGIADPHTVFSQLDEVKYQYGCFLFSHRQTGVAVVPAPAALGQSCPQ